MQDILKRFENLMQTCLTSSIVTLLEWRTRLVYERLGHIQESLAHVFKTSSLQIYNVLI